MTKPIDLLLGSCSRLERAWRIPGGAARAPQVSEVSPCGGGGLTAGLALACPDAEIVPVEPEGWDDVRLSLERGEIVPVPNLKFPTQCDALQTPATWPINFAVLKQRVARGYAVTAGEVRAAQRWAFANLHLVVEPGGAAALAAVLAGKVPTDGRTAIVLSGGNTDPDAFAKVLIGTVSTGGNNETGNSTDSLGT